MKSLTTVLNHGRSERPVCAWLKRNPLVLCHAIGGFAFPTRLVAEFPFGSDFKADFVGLGPFSGGWYISFIELEPPGARLFTKSGATARRLNGAIAQVDSWKTFIEGNRQCILRELSKFSMHRELIWGRDREPTDHVGWRLYDPRSSLHWYYFIVIGRRGEQDEESIQKKAEFKKHHGIEIMTYDRVVDAAKKLKNSLPKLSKARAARCESRG